MPTSEEMMRRIISDAVKKGRQNGLSDEEILATIESAVAESRTKGRDTGRPKKNSYTPMSDEEIRSSQTKLGFDDKGRVTKTVEMPQVLYGPPPRAEEVEVHYVEMPQVLYGPPPREELHEMFEEDQSGNGGKNPQRKK